MEKTFIEWLKNENHKTDSISKLDLKIKYFEYFVSHLIKQTKDYEEFKNNDFSILKVQKLLFLSCAVNVKLLDIFDNWYAMPYGHIEKDIYDYTRKNKGKFSFFTLTTKNMKLESNGNVLP